MAHFAIGVLVGILVALLGPWGIAKLRDLISKA